MIDEKIKDAMAPCGLCCTTCFAHKDGDIRKYSLKLKEKLGNFHINAKRFETMLDDPVFKKYSVFKEVLDYFASENCSGCRKEQCRIFKNFSQMQKNAVSELECQKGLLKNQVNFHV